ncbi:MAG: S9 family peptidase [Bacteroidaceae bacterium]|nr:S9 family peptidase [Bacteroidaceae bacterium]
MKKTLLFLLSFATAMATYAAGRDLQLKEVVNGTFSPKGFSSIHPMNDGEHFAKMSSDRTMVLCHSFKTGEVTDTIFNIKTARGCNFRRIDGFIFSPDEARMLIQTRTNRIYRRSFTAEYYVFSRKNNKMHPLSENGAQQEPIFSPDGTMIAFARNNNLFLVKLLFGNSESQITTDGKYGEIINGLPDWVYEEEFATSRSFDFSADSKMLAYIRYDESKVMSYDMPMYIPSAGESNNEYDDYKKPYSYKYPVAGAQNSVVTVHSFDIKNRVTRKLNLPIDSTYYIPRIEFTQDPEFLAVITLNRHQNQMDIIQANPLSGICKRILREESPEYINETTYQELTFYKNHFVMQSERDGYNHLYLYTIGGNLVKQLTKGAYDVNGFIGWDEKKNHFYYSSNEGNPTQSAVYRIDNKNKKNRITQEEGTNSATFSTGLKYFVNTYQNLTTPPVVTLNDNNGKRLATLLDNSELKEKLTEINMGQKEIFTFTTEDGVKLYGWMIKPTDFDPNKKYPVIMHQYSGPYSQKVKDSWAIGQYGGGLFESYMASNGFIMVSVDGRGTAGRGTKFGKCTYMSLGIYESKDQVQAAKYLGSLPYVDKDNIAIWGWSFGGYNTLMAMSEGTPVFKAGVAIAAPTDWRFYDTVYTERYMRTPKENKEGYDKGSAIVNVNKLHGNLLLIHGTADDNVHFRNMTRYIHALTQAGKQFSTAIYPDSNHSIYFGSNTRRQMFEMITNFFFDNLKNKR